MGLLLTVLPCIVQRLCFQQQAHIFPTNIFFDYKQTRSWYPEHRRIGLCCVIVRVAILALDNIAIYDISLGSIAAVILILFAAQYGGVAGGAIAGTATGVMLGAYNIGSQLYIRGICICRIDGGIICSAGKSSADSGFYFWQTQSVRCK